MPHLFSELKLRDLTLKNRVVMAPMCMYSAADDGSPGKTGAATDFHFAHIAARALGGVGLIIMEASAVERRGRISVNDLGLWSDEQIAPLARIVDFAHAHGAKIGIQLAHAGRKAFTAQKGVGPQQPVGASALPFDSDFVVPQAMTPDDLDNTVAAFAAAARRALAAGFDTVEIHSAHGYLLHSFVSPLSNRREDDYGGGTENRARLLWRVAEAVRALWPDHLPVLTRISASDWHPAGLSVQDWEPVVAGLQERGIDLIDVSSGGNAIDQQIEVGPGYQTAFAAHIRRACAIPTAAVGLITSPQQADTILRSGQADLIALARVLLREPFWALEAARVLGHEVEWPRQYERGRG